MLITGGLGFIGTNYTLDLLNSSNHPEIRLLDNLGYTANPELLLQLQKRKGVEFIEGDIRNPEVVDHAVKGSDVVVNLAAETFVDNSISSSRIFFETNIMGTHNIFESAKRHKVTKLIHASTDEVWGHLASDEPSFTEKSPYAPRNPYAASKAGTDLMIKSFGDTYGFPYNIIHFTNLYGPWQYPEKLIPKAITNLIEGEKVSIYGDGQNIRMWLHVTDAVKGLDKVIHEGMPGEAYALGSQDELTNLQIADMLLDIFGKTREELVFVADRPGNDLRYAVDHSKITNELGWRPQISIREGLQKKVTWLKEHGDWRGRRK